MASKHAPDETANNEIWTLVVIGETLPDRTAPTLASTGDRRLIYNTQIHSSSVESMVEMTRAWEYNNWKITDLPSSSGHFPIYKLQEYKINKKVLICNCKNPNCTLVTMLCFKCLIEPAVQDNKCATCLAKSQDAENKGNNKECNGGKNQDDVMK